MTRLFLCSAAALGLSASLASADYTVTILHTNDLHSRLEPINRFDSGCKPEDNDEGKCFGGAARLITAIEEARERLDNPLLVDAGDQFQGSLYYSFYLGQVAAEMMNSMGYQAMTVGNHEFNHGPENLARFANAVNFPVLMANADYANEPALAEAIQPAVVLEQGGDRIGVIGLTPEDNPELSAPGPNITFLDPIEATRAQVDRMLANGINKIIVLSHSGLPVDLRLAEAVPEIDVIVGGHDNTLLSNTIEGADGPYPIMVGTTAIVQSYAFGKYLGELEVTFDDAGVITSATGEPTLLDASVVEDTDTKARLAELAAPLDEIRNEVVAESAGFIEGDRSVCRVAECPMGNLIADAMLDRVKDQGVQIAYMNSGGVRSSIDEGVVTMGEVMTVLPFQNTLSTFGITGQGIIDALENGVSQVEEVKGRFPQVAGLTFSWDPSVAPNEGRVISVMVGDAPIDPAATYLVVTNNFVRNGGDGYSMFAEDAIDAYDFGPDLADVVAEYMAKVGPVAPMVEGRITQVQ
ncbi:MAG: 5'-nucleotidase C-terminal domain-containing protein [Pseudomonadota bacterium]